MVATEISSEQRVVLHDVSWSTYAELVSDCRDQSGPRLTFDQGTMEIMSPGSAHERINRTLARLVWTVALELGIEIEDVGSMTYKRASVQRGFEPDSSFYLTRAEVTDSEREIDSEVDPAPDLVIEVDLSRSSIPKFELYASLNVPEVWIWASDRATFYLLSDGKYASSARSRLIPILSPDIVTAFVASSKTLTNAMWHRSVLDWLRSQ